MGIVQDALLGARLFTERDNFLDKVEVMNLLMWLPSWDGTIPQPAILKPTPLWTGKQLFSLLLPDISIRRKSGWHDTDSVVPLAPADTEVIIHRGQLLSGIVCKKTLGTSSGGVVHVAYMQHSPQTAQDFLTNTQFMMNQWLQHRGFSVGIGDLVLADSVRAAITSTLQVAKTSVDSLVRQLHNNQISAAPGHSKHSAFELKVNQVLNAARDDAGKLVKLHPYNGISLMSQAGSKGSSINISQMTACVGQQNVEGRRIGFGFQDRSMPHFQKYDRGPASGGFVDTSYYDGLSPISLFMHAMGGREGLVDTAVKTSSTGYIQRRLIKAMEDVIVCYDGTVRTSGGLVTQFLYGEDGMSGTCVEQQMLEHLVFSTKKFKVLISHAQ